MRALGHVGLAVALVLAPTLCCCKVRGLGALAHAAPTPDRTSCPNPIPAPPVESCCMKVKTSCCQQPADAPEPTPVTPTDPAPAKPAAPGSSCACCAERPDAAQTESQPTVAAAEPTGELLSLAEAALAAGTPEHTGRFRGGRPADATGGVDARYAALFERHVMHC